MELVLVGVGFGIIFGTLGYCLGRDGFIENMYWTNCVFKGDPPVDYKTWNEFLMSKVKQDVTIQASTADDWSAQTKVSN